MRAYEDSLQRLGIARVDVLLVHDLDRLVHGPSYEAHLSDFVTGGYQALRDLRNDGKVRAIGSGVNAPGQIPLFLDLFELDMFLVAGPYTLLDQGILDSELARCVRDGVSVVIGAPFRYGILATGTRRYQPGPFPLSDSELDRTRRIETICEELGVALAGAALQFPLGHEAVASVLFGATDGDQLRQTISYFRAPVPDALWGQLRADGLIADNAPTPAQGQ